MNIQATSLYEVSDHLWVVLFSVNSFGCSARNLLCDSYGAQIFEHLQTAVRCPFVLGMSTFGVPWNWFSHV